MGTYKYTALLLYADEGTNEPIRIYGDQIDGFTIVHDYNSEAIQPMALVNVNIDKNLIDQMVKNKDKGRINFIVKKVDVSTEPKVELDYINTICTYEMNDDVFSEKTLIYGADRGDNHEDVYSHTTIGLMSEDLTNLNVVSADCTIKECNMMGAVCHFTAHMPIVIEPFQFNKDIDQLIIEPLESIKEIIRYLSNIATFYDTPIRYFMEYDCTYLLSSKGIATPKEGEEYSTVIIRTTNPDEDGDAFEQGIYLDSKQKCYMLKILSDDSNFKADNTRDKDFNKLIGVIDPSREMSVPSLLEETMNQVMSSAQGVMDAVNGGVEKIKDGTNNVIRGKFKIDYEAKEASKTINIYQNTAETARSACSGFISKFNLSQFDVNLTDKIKDMGHVPDHVTDCFGTMTAAQGCFTQVKDMSCTTSYNTTSAFTTLIEGVKPYNITDNIGLMTSQVPDNERNHQEIDNLTIESNDNFCSSQDTINNSFDLSKDTIERTKKALEQALKQAQAAQSSSGSSSEGGSGSSSSGSSSSGEDDGKSEAIQKAIEQCDKYINMIGNQQNQVNGRYDEINNWIQKGRDYAQQLVSTQEEITPNITDLENMKSMVDDVIGKFENIMTDINKVTKEFTNNIKTTVKKAEAMAGLGIASLSELTDISKIADLTEVGKLGVTAIQSNDMSILKSGDIERVKFISLDNDDPNKIKAMQKAVEIGAKTLTITKEGIDNSIISLNKEYLVQNTQSKTEENGRYLLRKKQEMYTREDELFNCQTIMDFAKVPDNN